MGIRQATLVIDVVTKFVIIPSLSSSPLLHYWRAHGPSGFTPEQGFGSNTVVWQVGMVYHGSGP